VTVGTDKPHIIEGIKYSQGKVLVLM